MKKYTRPELDIRWFSFEAIVTESGVSGYTSALTEWQGQNEGAQLTKAKMNDLQNIVKFTF